MESRVRSDYRASLLAPSPESTWTRHRAADARYGRDGDRLRLGGAAQDRNLEGTAHSLPGTDERGRYWLEPRRGECRSDAGGPPPENAGCARRGVRSPCQRKRRNGGCALCDHRARLVDPLKRAATAGCRMVMLLADDGAAHLPGGRGLVLWSARGPRRFLGLAH